MNITAKDVQELREITNLQMMECKKALVEAGGDKEKALKILKERGLAVAAKRADRDAKEGIVGLVTDGSKAAMIKLACETDFVAKNDTFLAMAQDLAGKVLAQGEAFATSEAAKAQVIEGGAKTGEKVELLGAVRVEAAAGFVGTYVHHNKKIGVIAEFKGLAALASDEGVKKAVLGVCQQIAAMDPVALSPDQVPENVKAEQKELFIKQMADSGKPADVVEKIVAGKLVKHLAEMCLLEMEYFQDAKLKIKDLVGQAGKAAGGELSVVRYHRLQIGK